MESDETEVLKFRMNSCRYQERQQERISMFWEKKTKIRKHIIFYGRVQGVGVPLLCSAESKSARTDRLGEKSV